MTLGDQLQTGALSLVTEAVDNEARRSRKHSTPAPDRIRAMHLARSTRWVVLCASVLIGVAASGCSSAPSVSMTPVSPAPVDQTVAASASSSPGIPPAPCFTVILPAGWASQITQHCGLSLNGPTGAGVGISVDTEPIDAATMHDLLAEKYSDVKVSEEAIKGEQVLIGTGAVPGAVYIAVQARSATSNQAGYYAQGLTREPGRIAEIQRILATIQTTHG